jgi:hypothetical protein
MLSAHRTKNPEPQAQAKWAMLPMLVAVHPDRVRKK